MATDYRPLSDDAQAQALSQLMAQCFLVKPEQSDAYLDRIGRDRFRSLYDGSYLMGGLALISMAQWWHGSRVPMTGIAGVGIAPDYRGSGAAIALMRHTLQELYEQHVPLSVLYPAAQRLYRKVGYEQGGSYCTWNVPLNQIQVQERSLPWRRIDPDLDQLAPLYAKKARAYSGHLDRAPAIWAEITQPYQEILRAYRIGHADDPQGYLLFTQQHDAGGNSLRIRDWVALTPAAGRSLWNFMSNHRSQIQQLRFKGALVDPMLLLLPEQVAQMTSLMYWMLRLVHVPQALTQRGYPVLINTELHLDIRDEALPGNQERLTLAIAQGQGTVTPGGAGRLTIDIRGLNALYAGHATPYSLQQAGLLDGDDESLAIAAQIFTTASAWMPDFF